jgi:hypothetical protein
MDADAELELFPDLEPPAPGLPRWEVTFTVKRRDGGEPFVPLGVPSGAPAVACWTAEEGTAVAWVSSATEDAAWAAASEACPGWADLPGVTVEAVPA